MNQSSEFKLQSPVRSGPNSTLLSEGSSGLSFRNNAEFDSFRTGAKYDETIIPKR